MLQAKVYGLKCFIASAAHVSRMGVFPWCLQAAPADERLDRSCRFELVGRRCVIYQATRTSSVEWPRVLGCPSMLEDQLLVISA